MNAAVPVEHEGWDAIVIGGGIGGLIAAAYLARWRKRVLLLEARETFGGRAETNVLIEGVSAPVAAEIVYALDPQVIRDFKLYQRGLRYVERAMPLVALHPSGRHLELSHEFFAARSAIRKESVADARAYIHFRRELFAFARRMRPLWAPPNAWMARRNPGGSVASISQEFALSSADTERLDRAAHSSADAYLERWFDTDALKTALAFDATIDGVGPEESSSALMLVWRAAQECDGTQGAAGQVEGGPGALAKALATVAREEGATLRPMSHVVGIVLTKGKAAGVTLDNGMTINAPIVLSSLSASQTFGSLLPADAQPFGTLASPDMPARVASAKVLVALNGLPPFAGLSRHALRGRLVVAERPESVSEAKSASLLGILPENLVVEATIPTIADPSLSQNGLHVLSLRIPYLPAHPQAGWTANRDVLQKRVLSMLEVYAPGLSDRIVASAVLTPEDFRVRYGAAHGRSNLLERLLQPYETRIRTPVEGFYLCGADAEPADAISGRSGRIAAMIALAETRDAGRTLS